MEINNKFGLTLDTGELLSQSSTKHIELEFIQNDSVSSARMTSVLRKSCKIDYHIFLLLLPILFYSINVIAGCSVNASAHNFGNYQPFRSQDTKNTSTITVFCNNVFNTWVTMSLSTGSSGNYTNRKLQSSRGNILYYNLYTNNPRTIIFGNGTGGSSTVTKRVRPFRTRLFRVYGSIPALQSIPPGVYNDNIMVTISF